MLTYEWRNAEGMIWKHFGSNFGNNLAIIWQQQTNSFWATDAGVQRAGLQQGQHLHAAV